MAGWRPIFRALKWGVCALHHGIQNPLDAILAYNPALRHDWARIPFHVEFDVLA